MSAPYMTVYSVISLPNILYTHLIYIVLANATCISPVYIRFFGRDIT